MPLAPVLSVPCPHLMGFYYDSFFAVKKKRIDSSASMPMFSYRFVPSTHQNTYLAIRLLI